MQQASPEQAYDETATARAAGITIVPVSGRRLLRQFIDLPAVLYRDTPAYEPPLHLDRARLLDPRRSAFCRRGIVQYWLAFRGPRPVGRISAQIAHDRPVGVPENSGMFGCLDAIDDREVVVELVNVAEEWLRAKGCIHVHGPYMLDMLGEPGLLVHGYERPPLPQTPWHPPYLRDHVEALGYAKWQDVSYWGLDLRQHDVSRLGEKMRLKERHPRLSVRRVTWRSLRKDMPLLRDIFNDGWGNNWGHVPLTLEDMHGLKLIAPLLPPEAGRIIELDGQPAAIYIAIPNTYELTHGLGPHPSPLGWLRLLWRLLRFKPKSGLILLLGISSRLRFSAASAAIILTMIDEMITSQEALGIDWVEGGWVLEDNTALTKLMARFNFTIARTYRIYRKSLA